MKLERFLFEGLCCLWFKILELLACCVHAEVRRDWLIQLTPVVGLIVV